MLQHAIFSGRWRRSAAAFALACALGSVAAVAQKTQNATNPADPVVRDPSRFDPKRPLERELTMSAGDGFTLVAVGDCIISRPLSQYGARQPGLAAVIGLLQKGDATYGNLETSILDLRKFQGYPYAGQDDVPLVSEPAVAKDLAHMGFDLVSRSNNHALDWGIEGMRETSQWLDQAGLIHAGSGENRGLARSARYFESLKGRVALVSMASTFRPTTDALPAQGAAPARPGISALNLKRTMVVPPEGMAQLVRTMHVLYPDYKEQPQQSAGREPDAKTKNGLPEKLSLFGMPFELGNKFEYRYEMDPLDLEEILKNIRQGKQHSDFLVASIHSHEPATSTAPKPQNELTDSPAGFLRDLAKAAIDAGADAFVTTGIHHLGPIEVYKGRPIFYGLADFFWSDLQEPLPADVYQLNRESLARAFASPSRATDADLTNLTNADYFAAEPPFQSIVTESRFEHGRLAELRLYPVDLGYGMKLTESGIPRLASPEKGLEILKRLQTISVPYGTKIEIGNFPPLGVVGVIRP